jgi:hypothetical protein
VLVDAPGTSTRLRISHEILINVGFGDISIMRQHHAHCNQTADMYLVVSKNGESLIGNTNMEWLLRSLIHAAPDGVSAVTLVITHPGVRSLLVQISLCANHCRSWLSIRRAFQR